VLNKISGLLSEQTFVRPKCQTDTDPSSAFVSKVITN